MTSILKENDMNQLDTFYRANAVIPRSHGESIIKFVLQSQKRFRSISNNFYLRVLDIIKFNSTYLVCVFRYWSHQLVGHLNVIQQVTPYRYTV